MNGDADYVCELGGVSATNTSLQLKSTSSGKIIIDPQNIIYTSPQLGIVAFGDPSKVSVKDRSGKALSPQPQSPGQQAKVMGKPPPSPQQTTNVVLHASMEEDGSDGEDQQQLQLDASVKEVGDLNDLMVEFMCFTKAPICWELVRLPEKSDLCRTVCNRLVNLIHPDCVVSVAGHEFSCHLVVLQSYSAYFDERSGHTFELPPDRVSPDNFTLIYSWMISGTQSCRKVFSRFNVISLYLSAQFLGVPELEEQCWAFMTDQKLFNEETALALCLQAYAIRIYEVVQLMVPRVVNCFLPLVGSSRFSKLPLGVLTLLLRSNFIAINCEYEVFMAGVKWLMSDWPSRMKHTVPVMACVRFGLLEPWQLVDIRRNPANPEFLQVSGDPMVADMLDRGMAYSVNRSHFSSGGGGAGGAAVDSGWLERLELEEPEPRNWLGDGCKNYESYQQFLRAVAPVVCPDKHMQHSQ